MNIDKALEYLDKAVVAYEATEDSLRDNWKPLAIGAGVGAVGAALFWFWAAKKCC